MRLLLVAAAFVSFPALAQITVEQAWTRATPPGSRVAAGYMVLRSGGAADRLISVASAAAERVELHTTVREGEVTRMRQVKAYDVPARGRFELKPGGAHLMFVNIKAPFKEGEKVALVLGFEKAGEVKTDLHVGRLGAGSHQHKGH